jgi:hypothetical protein
MYSAGGAHAALKLAFMQTNKPYSLTLKVIHQSDKTADEARRRIESQLKSLGVDKAAFFVCWSVSSYEQFLEITRNGGVYDGALKLKEEGLIDHICCSLHASTEDSIKIIQSGAFETATVSFNLANAVQTIPILDSSLKHDVDIAVMNPLGGGGIPQNPEFFSFAKSEGEDIVTAALRFAKSHPAVKVVLSGVNTVNELEESLKAFNEKSVEQDSERLIRVLNSVKDIDGYCNNCKYCDGCPVEIPVSQIMNKRNRSLFLKNTTQLYRRTDKELIKNINLFYGHGSSEWFPDSPKNPCTRCGQCESKCTQKLKIIESIEDMYSRAGECGFSLESRKEKLRELLYNKGYKKVGLYPKDRFADLIIKLYEQFFGKPDFEWIGFNSDPKMWGADTDGMTAHGPDDISKLNPDVIIVCNYVHEMVIYNDLLRFEDEGIKIVKLHRETDVPWAF